MPQPTIEQVHLDVPLTNISVAYMANPGIYIASKVFPIIPVDKKSDKYWKYTKNDWFRDEAGLRGDSEESAGSGYTLGTDNYSCDVWAFHKDVGYQARANADMGIDLDRDASEFTTGRLLLRQERQWATDYFATGIWGTDVTGVAGAPGASQFTQWSDYAGSSPITDIRAGTRQILSVTGMMPNTLVLGYDVFNALADHPDFVERIKYTSDTVITEQLMARYFRIDRVLVAQSIYATNQEGQAEAYSFIHGKAALLCYVNPSPSLLAPSAGYIFAWKGVSGNLGTTIGTSRIPVPLRKADRIEGEIAFDDKVVGTDLGYFFASAVA